MELDSRIFVAGHRGLVGSAVVRHLEQQGFRQLLVRGRDELDLLDQRAVDHFFEQERPEFVVLAAAKVGGIHANRTYPADFISQNIRIQSNVIEASAAQRVRKLLFLGSSCIYPKLAPQPLQESALLTGPLEPTNRAYALAKIAGVGMCESFNAQHGTNFIAAMPTNLYGPHDNFDPQTSHVLPALIRKFHEGKQASATSVELWGTGRPLREFLYVDDLAEACVFLLKHFNATPEECLINVGVGEDVTIRRLAELVSEVVGYQGQLEWNSNMPDGTPRKVMDVSRLNAMGWSAKTTLPEGIRRTYEWFQGALS